MKKSDVVIVLGGGLGKNHKPVLYTKERLDFLVKHKGDFLKLPMIVSGKHSLWMKETPKHTEAVVMKKFLVKKGFDPGLIILEDQSMDTIGNIYFSKQIIKKHPEWKKILIVTTDGHIPRSKWLFNKFFGRSYKIQFLSVPSKLTSITHPGRRKYEQYIIDLNKRKIGKFKDGDDGKIMRAMRKFHPAYSKSREAKAIQNEIFEMKKKLLGFTNPIPG